MKCADGVAFSTRRLKYAVSLRRDRAEGDDAERRYVGLEDVESWIGRLVAATEESLPQDLSAGEAKKESTSTTFEPGDVLFGKLRPYLAKVVLADFPGRCSTELLVMRSTEVEPRFLRYVCLWRAFIDAVDGSTFGSKMPRADWEFIGHVAIPAPPMPAQRAIADYLDRETSRLDALVAAKRRLVRLLAEKRVALVSRAITRGLETRARLKDSGVPWIGEIPAHWDVIRAHRLFVERDERSETGDEEMLTVSHITGVTRRSEKDVNMFEAETTEGYKLCRNGDFVTNTLWAWMGAMGVAHEDGIVSPAYNVYELGPRLDPGYVDAFARMPVFAQEVTRYSKGVWSSRLRLYPEGFFEVFLPVPPIAEQRAIAAYVATEGSRIDTLRRATERSLMLISERRSALISAAVTGALPIA